MHALIKKVDLAIWLAPQHGGGLLHTWVSTHWQLGMPPLGSCG